MGNLKKREHYLPVLLYHRVVNYRKEAGRHKIYLTVKKLRQQFSWLRRNGYETITFRDIYEERIRNFRKKVIMTFDDGYRDNYTLLFPLLKEFQFTAVIFLVTGLRHNEWGIREGEPALSLLEEHQIKEMEAYGVEFGGHSRSHATLTLLSQDNLKEEVSGCMQDLRKFLTGKIISFSYPFGAANEEVRRVTREAGFLFGVSTDEGPDRFTDDPLQIKRIEVQSHTRFYRFKLKASGHYFTASPWESLLYMLNLKI